jgi:hypothetical protein
MDPEEHLPLRHGGTEDTEKKVAAAVQFAVPDTLPLTNLGAETRVFEIATGNFYFA